MPSRKKRFLGKLLFITLNYIIFNAVFFTALILFFGISKIYLFRIPFVLFNVSMIISVVILMPILTERTLYQDKTASITVRGITAGVIVFVALMWLAGIFSLSIKVIISIYFSLIIADTLVMVLLRITLKRKRKEGTDTVNAIIIGATPIAVMVERELLRNSEYGYNLIGYIAENPNPEMISTNLGKLADLNNLIEKNNIHQIYFISGNGNHDELTDIVRVTNNNFIRLFIIPSLGQFTHRRLIISDSSLGILTLSLREERLLKPFNRAVKRIFDFVFSICSLVMLAIPVMLPIAIAVKLSSPGPIIFRQKRNGYHGKEFTCYKFRSMVVNDASDEALTSRNDWRITRAGAFLRRTSLDELPQLFNVLKGNMSVVGPRPHMIKQTGQYRQIIDDYMVRHIIKPGITGWAQINNLRGTTETPADMSRRVEADIWYIDNWSLMLDIKIIFRTIYNIIFTREEQAY